MFAGADVDGIFAEVEAGLGEAVDIGGGIEGDGLELGVGGGGLGVQGDLDEDFVGAVDLGDELEVGEVVAGLIGFPDVFPGEAVGGGDGDGGGGIVVGEGGGVDFEAGRA